MTTRWEATEAPKHLSPSDFIYLQDGPRSGQTLLAPQHSGKIVIGQAAHIAPRLGAELVYEPVPNMKTSEGARCYRLVVPRTVEQ